MFVDANENLSSKYNQAKVELDTLDEAHKKLKIQYEALDGGYKMIKKSHIE